MCIYIHILDRDVQELGQRYTLLMFHYIFSTLQGSSRSCPLIYCGVDNKFPSIDSRVANFPEPFNLSFLSSSSYRTTPTSPPPLPSPHYGPHRAVHPHRIHLLPLLQEPSFLSALLSMVSTSAVSRCRWRQEEPCADDNHQP